MGFHRRSSQSFNQAWVLAALMSAIGLCSAEPAKAFIPYVFTPSTQELEGAGIGIGRTAAQLISLGQPKEIGEQIYFQSQIQNYGNAK